MEFDRQRGLGLNDRVRSGHGASDFPGPSDLDGLRYLRRRKGRGLRGRPWSDLSSEAFASKLKGQVERLRSQDGTLVHSLASGYGLGTEQPTSAEAFEDSAISLEDWTEFLGGLSERVKTNWHAKHKPLYVPKEHVYVYLSVLGGLVKKTYTMAHAA